MMDPELRAAIQKLHKLDEWVHLATIGPDGGPHVTPVMMGMDGDHLLFSITGKQKKRNVERDNRACVSIAKPVTMAHVIVWGRMELQHGEQAQAVWDKLISDAFGDAGLSQRNRALSLEGTSLGVLTPERHRIYGLENQS